jgi:hypothetical protein
MNMAGGNNAAFMANTKDFILKHQLMISRKESDRRASTRA